jgi:glycosyltransferase involved in cell wall biosynthesis
LTLRSARRLPWVVHWHSDVVASRIDARLAWAYRCYRPLERALLARCATILAATQRYLETSVPLAAWRDKCRVVPYGIAAQRLPPPGPASRQWAEGVWRPGGFRVLSVGRLTYYKGQEFLVQAAAACPAMQVCLVGKGDLWDKLQAAVTRCDLGARVQLLGYVDDERVRGLLATCDCFCLPSVERSEAFGISLCEAMRYGKPVVAADIPGSGVGWVVEAGRTGLLVPPGDAGGLAAALERLRCDPGFRAELGREAAESFHRRFDIEAVAHQITDIYRDVTRRAGRL